MTSRHRWICMDEYISSPPTLPSCVPPAQKACGTPAQADVTCAPPARDAPTYQWMEKLPQPGRRERQAARPGSAKETKGRRVLVITVFNSDVKDLTSKVKILRVMLISVLALSIGGLRISMSSPSRTTISRRVFWASASSALILTPRKV